MLVIQFDEAWGTDGRCQCDSTTSTRWDLDPCQQIESVLFPPRASYVVRVYLAAKSRYCSFHIDTKIK